MTEREALADEFTVGSRYMSEFTNQEVASHFITREIDTVAVKGKVDGIKVVELIAARDSLNWSWDSLAFRTEAAKEHPTFLTRVSQLPQAKALEPILGQFNIALHNYRAQKFDEAIAGFQEIVDAVQDPVSKVFVERCNQLKVDPPETNWDGVYRPKNEIVEVCSFFCIRRVQLVIQTVKGRRV